jgi:hypothetical protein
MRSSLIFGGLAGLAAAQFPPEPEGLKVLKSKLHENVTITYKEVSGSSYSVILPVD